MYRNRIATGALLLAGFSLQAQDAGGKVIPDNVLLWVLIGTILLLAVINFVISGTIKGMASDKDLWKLVKEKMDKKAAGVITLGLVFSTSSATAQTVDGPFVMGDQLFYALVAMILILLFLVFYQVNVLRGLIKTIKGEEAAEETVMDTWASALTDTVPIEKEADIMFEHEHDGIRELDNNLPPWWLYGFYFTIAFGVFYIPYYHFGSGPSSAEEYATEMAKAEEEKAAYMASLSNLIDETNVEIDMGDAALAEGKEVYTANCVACHGTMGEGGVGPNFTDEYWLHGGGIKNVFKTIKYGVPTKGMIPWEAQLSPGQMKNVASYILSMQGTNPPNAKEPQGELWKPEGEPAEEAQAAPADGAEASEAPSEAPPEGEAAEAPDEGATEEKTTE